MEEPSREDLLRFVKKKAKQLKAREEEVARLQARVRALEQGGGGAEAGDDDDHGGDGEHGGDAARQEAVAAAAKKDETVKKLREVAAKFKALQTRFAKVKAEQAETAQKNEALERELVAARQRVEELEVNVGNLQEMVRSGIADVEGAEKRAQEALAETQEQLVNRERFIGDLQAQLEGLQQERDEGAASLETERQTAAQARADLDQARATHAETIERLERDLEEARTRTPPADVNALDGLQTELEDALASSSATIEQLRKELDNARTSCAPNAEDEEIMSETIETLRRDLEEARARSAMREENETAFTQTIGNLRDELDAAQKKLETSEGTIANLREELSQVEARLKAENEENVSTIAELRKELAAMQERPDAGGEEDAATITELRKELAEMQERLSAGHEEDASTIAELRKELAEMQERADAGGEEDAAAIAELRKELAEMQERLDAGHEDDASTIAELRKALSEAQERLNTGNEDDASTIAELRNELAVAQERLNTSNEDDASTIAELRKELAELQERLDAGHEDDAPTIAELRKELAEAQERLVSEGNNEEDIDKLRKELADAQGRISTVEQETSATIEGLQRALAEAQDSTADSEVAALVTTGASADAVSASSLDGLLQALALAESREELAMDASLRATAALAAAQEDRKLREEESANERAAIERKVLEWKKRCAELSKRFKALKDRFGVANAAHDEAKRKHLGAVLQLIDRSWRVRQQQAAALSHWRRLTTAKARAEVLAQVDEARVEAGRFADEEREGRGKMEQECKRLEEEVRGHEAFSQKLKRMLSEAREEAGRLRESEAAAQAAPAGFDPAKDAMCVVKVDDSRWVCVRGGHSHTEMSSAGVESGQEGEDAGANVAGTAEAALRWVRVETFASWAKGKRYTLPDPVDDLVRRECEHRVHEFREQAAWALAEKEHLENDLAKAKRNAQLAVKAAKEGAKKVDAKAKATEAKLRAQLESELARVTRQADKRQEEIETIQAEKANIDIALSAARRDLAAAEKSKNVLEASIAERFEDMRSRLSRVNEEALESARIEHQEAIAALSAKSEKLAAELEAAREAAANAEKSVKALESERKRSESARAAAVQEAEELRARLEKVQQDMATRKTPAPVYWGAGSGRQVRGAAGFEPETTGAESERDVAIAQALGNEGSAGDGERSIMRVLNGSKDDEGGGMNSGRASSFGSGLDDAEALAAQRRRQQQNSVDPLLAAAAAASASGSAFGDVALGADAADSAASVASQRQSQSLFVEQLDVLRTQQARERVVWQRERDELQDRVTDAENARRLLLEQAEVLKEEIRESRRSQARTQTLSAEGSGPDVQRAEENLTYLKHVVFKYMVATDASERKTLLPVVGTILQFGPQDLAKIKDQIEAESGGAGVAAARGVVGMLFGGGGSG